MGVTSDWRLASSVWRPMRVAQQTHTWDRTATAARERCTRRAHGKGSVVLRHEDRQERRLVNRSSSCSTAVPPPAHHRATPVLDDSASMAPTKAITHINTDKKGIS
jgi:hypothetical protein